MNVQLPDDNTEISWAQKSVSPGVICNAIDGRDPATRSANGPRLGRASRWRRSDMTTRRKTTRRLILRLAGATAGAGVTAGAVAACSGDERGTVSPTSSDSPRPIGLPYLFDGDPGAQQIARRLLAAASGVEDLHTHEQFMRLAIEMSNGNPKYPFAAVIVDRQTGEVLGRGVNRRVENPMFHGEVVAINDYVARHGDVGWDRATLYTTGEPCAMCCGAVACAGIPRVVWASSIATILGSGIPQMNISAVEMAARSYQFYQPELFLGGVLADEMDKRFATRVR